MAMGTTMHLHGPRLHEARVGLALLQALGHLHTEAAGSSDGVSKLRPQRGSRTMPMFGLQQSRPMWGRLEAWFSPTPCSQSERSSTPITSPMLRQTDRLKLVPRVLGFGKDVGQRPSSAQRDWTPWMQLPPQSYSGMPRRLTLPLGELRAMRSVGFSSSVSSEIRSSSRVCSGSFGLQKAYVSCGETQARGMVVVGVARPVIIAVL